MRMTRQRKLILDALKQADEPRSADEIFQVVFAADPTLALSTVYRTLEKMRELGLCLQTRFQDGVARYEQAGSQHRHYLICSACGSRLPIEACPLHLLQTELEASTGYQITDHQLNLYGICPACQKRSASQVCQD